MRDPTPGRRYEPSNVHVIARDVDFYYVDVAVDVTDWEKGWYTAKYGPDCRFKTKEEAVAYLQQFTPHPIVVGDAIESYL